MKFLFQKLFLGLVFLLTLSGCGSSENYNGDERYEIYKYALADGYTGTYEEWLSSIKGKDGKDGSDGHTPIIVIGDNGNWYIDGIDSNVKAQGDQGPIGPSGPQGDAGSNGIQGEKGSDGISIVSIIKTDTTGLVDTYTITYSDDTTSSFEVTNGLQGIQGVQGTRGEDGHAPIITIGNNGNWYIDDIDSNVKAQGSKGVSITDTHIDENGDLIVEFSDGSSSNAGHIKEVSEYMVYFYCGDLLVDIQNIKHGNIIKKPVLDDFIVNHWYLDKDFEYEWYWYGNVVTEDMTLYGDYKAVTKNLTFSNQTSFEVDAYGFGTINQNDKEVCASKAVDTENCLTTLENKGILFNKSEIGLINEVSINIANENFTSAKLYYGKTPLSFDNVVDLTPGNNVINLFEAEYFTIQNTSINPISIISLNISYGKKAKYIDESLPTIVINTENSQNVTSRIEYISCTVSTIGSDSDVSNLKAQIKIRGNSTAGMPKKPYRIKLDKKNSLFGYQKAKNWVLLAEYMDGSNMHNYTALKFAKMLRGEDTFGVDPLHVNVCLNGKNIGIYTFGEHIDAKEGRLDIEQDNIWEDDFNDINFYIERDESTLSDSTEKEGETYFKVQMQNYSPSQYVFALKYPEKEDFEEKLDDGSIDYHEEEFQNFFNSLKEYMTNVCNKFVDYSHDASEFTAVSSVVDVESLAMYGAIDQAFAEKNHSKKSFKMYRVDGGLLQFGPNWDYDSCAYALPYQGTYILNPFSVRGSYTQTSFGEKWGLTLFNDEINGRPLFKSIWDSVKSEQLESFINEQYNEMLFISDSSIYDCEKWMHNQYYCLFDNRLCYWRFISNQLPYLKSYYSN